jgi:hypothetical protein
VEQVVLVVQVVLVELGRHLNPEHHQLQSLVPVVQVVQEHQVYQVLMVL